MSKLTGLYLDSEAVSPTGNILPQGIINQLGRPSLDILAILVREAVQNSWDARASDDKPVHFGISGWELTQKQRHILREFVFAQSPPSSSLSLRHLLESEQHLYGLAVYDRGTVGLRGPTRADVYAASDVGRNFVDFLRNVGQPSDRQMSGGTYGFGKAAFYRASCARTICVHTRYQYKDRILSRFIAAALGSPYEVNGIRYTGRHWWGRKKEEIAEPLLDRDADIVAQALGLPGFSSQDCGTTIFVLQPALNASAFSSNGAESRTPRQALALAAKYLLWYFWPKMLKYDGGNPSMTFEVQWEGKQIQIPDPENYPPLQGFVQAMYRYNNTCIDAESPFGYKTIDVSSQRPARLLGKLVLQKFPIYKEHFLDAGVENDEQFENLAHHTALMRQPKLVVKYLSGTAMPSDKLGYAGVFVVDESVDAVFAGAEPPTHDNWVPDSLDERWHRTYIRVALRKIDQEMDSFAKPSVTYTASTALTPLGAFAGELGRSLLPSESGPAAAFKPLSSYPNRNLEDASPTQLQRSLLPFEPRTAGELKPINSYPSQNLGNTSSTQLPSINNLPDLSLQQPKEGNDAPPSEDLEQNVMADSSTSRLVHLHLHPSSESLPQSTWNSGGSAGAAQKTRRIKGRPSVKPLSDGEFVEVNGTSALKIEFSVKPAADSAGTLIHASVRAILEGSQPETEPPIGGSLAQVLEWITPDGTRHSGSASIYVPAETSGNWWVVVSLPDDIMVGIDLSGEAKPST